MDVKCIVKPLRKYGVHQVLIISVDDYITGYHSHSMYLY